VTGGAPGPIVEVGMFTRLSSFGFSSESLVVEVLIGLDFLLLGAWIRPTEIYAFNSLSVAFT